MQKVVCLNTCKLGDLYEANDSAVTAQAIGLIKFNWLNF